MRSFSLVVYTFPIIHVQVIAMENYLDHAAPVYQEEPPQDPSTGACARHKGPATSNTWPRLCTTWIQGRLARIHPNTNLHKPPSSGTLVDYKVQGTWDTNQEELDFKDDQARVL